MKKYALPLAVGMFLISTAHATPPTWSDEFNGTGPADPAIWSYEQGYQRNNELQYYTSNNGWQENGMFVIEAREEVTVDGPNTYNYTSSSIVSKNNYSFLYGRAQIRAKVPALAGMWPAIWTVGDVGTWPHNGECDIMEYYQNKILANCAVGTNVKWGAKWDSSSRTMASLLAVDPDWKDKFHIWTMQWDETNVRLYCDNILMNVIPQSWLVNGKTGGQVGGAPLEPFKQPHSLWLNLAVGGNAGGSVGSTPFPQRYYIDYWRVWEGLINNVAPTDIVLSNNSVMEGLPAGTVVGDLSAIDADPAEVIRYSLVAGVGDDDNALFEIPEFVSDSTTDGLLRTAAVLNYDNGPTRSVRVRATDIEGATYEEVLTITVEPDLRILIEQSDLVVQEGGSTTFDVKLSLLPTSDVTVSAVRLSGDADLFVSSGSPLVFTPANGTTWQQVTVSAVEDADITNGSAVIECVDLGGNFSSDTVNASEVDNDNSQPIVNIADPGTVYLSGSVPVDPVPGAEIFLDAGLDDGANATWEDSTGLWHATIDPEVTFIPDAGSGLLGVTSAYDFPGGLSGTGGCQGASLQDMGVDTLPITLEIWFKPDPSGSYPANGQVLWETGGGTGMGIFYNNGMVEAAHDSSQGQISADVSALTDEFIQVVVTYDPTSSTDNFKLYINGNLAVTSSRSDPDMCGSDGAGLGKRGGSNAGGAGGGDANTTSFDGQIAIFRSYHNQILSEADVATNFNSIFGNPVEVVLDGNVIEPDGEAYTASWTLVSGPGSVGFVDPTAVDTTATLAVAGNYVLRLTADDGTTVPGFADITISVVGTSNTPPSFTSDPFSTADAAVGFAYGANIVGSATDVDGDTLAYALVDAPTWLSVASNGTLSGTPSSAHVGVNAFTVSVTDGINPAVNATLNITVLNTNDAPVANADSVTTDKDAAVAITLTASDADGDTLSYAVTTQPTNGTLTGTAPGLTYTPSSGFAGSDSFTFTANDGTVDSNTATVSITVQAPFEKWAGGGNSPSGDSNGDGISDGLAWVLGATDPSSDATAMLPEIDVNSDPNYYMFTYRRNDEAHVDSGTTINVIYGDDMSTWSTATHDGSSIVITESDDYYGSGVDRVEVKINWDLLSNDKIFTRLQIEITP